MSSKRRAAVLLSFLWVLAPGCSAAPATKTSSLDNTSASAQSASMPARGPAPGPRDRPALRQPQPGRLVAIGDLHGDLAATRAALKLAGVIDDSDTWTGGNTVVVQVGDQLDRGDDERAILLLLERLADEAAAAGGALHALLGNHEIMNVALDLRYVTAGGFEDFSDVPLEVPNADMIPAEQRGRVAAFAPGGPWARLLSGHNVTLVVGETLFAHGGVVESHVRYGLARINSEISAWMRGETARPAIIDGVDSPVWLRSQSMDTTAADCEELVRTLAAVEAERLVVAHTVQPDGINSACDGRVWRVDVGLSSFYGGSVAVLEIQGDRVEALGASANVSN